MAEKNKVAAAERQRAWRNGMTISEMRAFFDAHGRKCAICDRPEEPGKHGGGLVIDHDHTCCGSQDPETPHADRPSRLCGKCARGLLCVACNAALGQFADKPERLRRAIAYLARETSEVTVTVGAHHDLRPRGGTHHKACFSDAEAEAIRDRYRAGGITQRLLAAELGVNRTTVEKLLTGRSYSGR